MHQHSLKGTKGSVTPDRFNPNPVCLLRKVQLVLGGVFSQTLMWIKEVNSGPPKSASVDRLQAKNRRSWTTMQGIVGELDQKKRGKPAFVNQ